MCKWYNIPTGIFVDCPILPQESYDQAIVKQEEEILAKGIEKLERLIRYSPKYREWPYCPEGGQTFVGYMPYRAEQKIEAYWMCTCVEEKEEKEEEDDWSKDITKDLFKHLMP